MSEASANSPKELRESEEQMPLLDENLVQQKTFYHLTAVDLQDTEKMVELYEQQGPHHPDDVKGDNIETKFEIDAEGCIRKIPKSIYGGGRSHECKKELWFKSGGQFGKHLWRVNPRLPRRCNCYKVWYCMVCDEAFEALDDCMMHQIEKCGLEYIQLRCGVCGRGCRDHWQLESHYKRYHVNLNVSC